MNEPGVSRRALLSGLVVGAVAVLGGAGFYLFYDRQAAGTALYDVMSDLMFLSAPTDRTLVEALIDAAKIHGKSWTAIEDPISGRLTYKRLLQAIAVLGAKLMPLALDQKVGTVVWSPLGGGRLTGKVRRGQPLPESTRLKSKLAMEIGPPVSFTSVPRTRPSVGFIEIARTMLSPMCWATSRVSERCSPWKS